MQVIALRAMPIIMNNPVYVDGTSGNGLQNYGAPSLTGAGWIFKFAFERESIYSIEMLKEELGGIVLNAGTTDTEILSDLLLPVDLIDWTMLGDGTVNWTGEEWLINDNDDDDFRYAITSSYNISLSTYYTVAITVRKGTQRYTSVHTLLLPSMTPIGLLEKVATIDWNDNTVTVREIRDSTTNSETITYTSPLTFTGDVYTFGITIYTGTGVDMANLPETAGIRIYGDYDQNTTGTFYVVPRFDTGAAVDFYEGRMVPKNLEFMKQDLL